MNLKKCVATLSLCVLPVTSGFAVEEAGPYVGLSVGQSKVKDFCEGAATCDDSDTGWKIFGGYRINPYFDVEGGYYNLGEASASGTISDPVLSFTGTLDSESWALVLSVKGNLPIGDRFALFGKLGVAHSEVEATLSGSGSILGTPFSGTFSDKDSGIGFAFGVGAQFNVIDNLGIRVEWERFNDAGGDFEADIDLLTIGAHFRF